MENNKKIIDLGILPENELSGVSMIALVEEPAIELDFQYFKKQHFGLSVHCICDECGWDWDLADGGNDPYICHECGHDNTTSIKEALGLEDACWKGYEPIGTKTKNGRQVPNCVPVKAQKFVKPTGGESKDEFISRCIGVVRGEGKDADQAAAICYSYWDESFDIDTAGLTPYVDPGAPKKKIGELLSPAMIETILKLASVLGIAQDDVKMVSHTFAEIPEDAVTLYKYEGRIRSNSRDFCRRLMSLGRFYFKEEIEAMDTMNEEFGPGVGGGQYSIFKYKGGANCGHMWQKYTGFYDEKGNWKVVETAPTSKEERTASEAPRTTQGRGFVKRPQRNLAPLSLSKMLFADEEQKIVVGPCMVPNMEILRRDDDGKPYYVRFSEETIKEIAMKYMKEARTNEINTEHIATNDAGTYVFESWIVESADDKANTIYGYNVPIGTWMCKMKVDDKETWKRIKAGELKGFSVEGSFADMEEVQARKDYMRIKNLLK